MVLNSLNQILTSITCTHVYPQQCDSGGTAVGIDDYIQDKLRIRKGGVRTPEQLELPRKVGGNREVKARVWQAQIRTGRFPLEYFNHRCMRLVHYPVTEAEKIIYQNVHSKHEF